MATKRTFSATSDPYKHEAKGPASCKRLTPDIPSVKHVLLDEESLVPIPDVTKLHADPTSRFSRLPRDIVLNYLHNRYLDPIGARDPAFSSRITVHQIPDEVAFLSVLIWRNTSIRFQPRIEFCALPETATRPVEMGYIAWATCGHGIAAIVISAKEREILAKIGHCNATCGGTSSEHECRQSCFRGITIDPLTSE